MTMHKALDSLSIKPEHIIVDGDKFDGYLNVPHQCIVKGDAIYYSIAAASILASVSNVTIQVAEFVYISGSIAFEKGAVVS